MEYSFGKDWRMGMKESWAFDAMRVMHSMVAIAKVTVNFLALDRR